MKLKNFLYNTALVLVVLLCLAGTAYVGTQFLHLIKWVGVTFLTARDVIGCYILAGIIFFILGTFGWVYVSSAKEKSNRVYKQKKKTT